MEVTPDQASQVIINALNLGRLVTDHHPEHQSDHKPYTAIFQVCSMTVVANFVFLYNLNDLEEFDYADSVVAHIHHTIKSLPSNEPELLLHDDLQLVLTVKVPEGENLKQWSNWVELGTEGTNLFPLLILTTTDGNNWYEALRDMNGDLSEAPMTLFEETLMLGETPNVIPGEFKFVGETDD